jgi:uncharacterized protein (TIGR04255 family)
MPQTRYSRAPLVDAVIDFVADFADKPPSIEQLKAFASSHPTDFPRIAATQEVSFGLAVPDGEHFESSVGQRANGFRLTSGDGSRVLIVRPNGLGVGHQPPYTEWGNFVKDAEKYWAAYVEAFEPKAVTRYAVRYINRIVIPEQVIDPEVYFNIYPHIPSDIPQAVNAAAMQLLIAQPDLPGKVNAVINFGLTAPDNPDTIAFILDLDVFEFATIPARSPELWKKLEALRERKNKLFESCITDKTRDLIR